MKNRIETERLILRLFTKEDINALFAIFSDKDVNTFLPMFPLRNMEEAKEYLRYIEEYAGYYYAICLKENNIPIDYVAGTSMGAIVAAFYAMGYTPDEMLRLIKSKEFASWSTGEIDPSYIYYFRKHDPSPAFISFKLSGTKSLSNVLPESFINPLPMNLGFLELFSPYTAACHEDFDNLFVPFRAVASDVYEKKSGCFFFGRFG